MTKAPPATSPAAAAATTPDVPAKKPILGLTESPVAGLAIGAYGEIHFGGMQNPAAGGQWQLGEDVARRKVNLKRGHARERSRRRADLRREVRQRRQIVAEHGGRVGEASPGKLHAVSRVTGEAHDDSLPLFYDFGHDYPDRCADATRTAIVRGATVGPAETLAPMATSESPTRA